MRPRRILTIEEMTEIVDAAVRENALAVLSVPEDDAWRCFKCRFLERDPNRRFFVLDYRDDEGNPPPLCLGQYVGMSFRHKSRKIMFASVLEAKGRFLVDSKNSVPAARYRWPESLTELQRRAYHRTPVPGGVSMSANLWTGGRNARGPAQGDPLAIVGGDALDLSCGGTLIKLNQLAPPTWAVDQTIGLELHLPDGRPPMLLDAYYRGTRHDDDGQLCAAVQFVGLELSADGRNILQRLARCVQKFHRMGMSMEFQSGSAAVDMS